MLRQVGRDFLMLLVTIDPIGTVALFVPLTASGADRRRCFIRIMGLLLAALATEQIAIGVDSLWRQTAG